MLFKENNPWVGLASYKRQDAARFFGREKETEKISELIQTNYCTILYGQSGAGKTSLIQAGICPLLAEKQFLPIPLKLDHSGSVSYARQIMDRVKEEIHGINGEIEFPISIPDGMDDGSRAWLFFHTANFWNGQNYRITPALFIDQFEELFNLTSDPLEVQGFFDLVDQLLQMVPPERISDCFEQNNIRLSYHEKPAFRLMLSLREDFLARLEDYSYNIPALRRNRVGLASMNGLQALDVIMNPIPGLVEREAALRILSKVTAKEVQDNPYFLEKTPVDSCILSLFCTEIYNQAAESGQDGITQDIIDQFGSNIIQTFYERNMDGISMKSAQYLESHLLTTNGFRNMVALEDLVPEHVRMEELQRLEENRIIRIETMNGTQRVEFTHDVLCKVASSHRKSRNEKKERRQGIRQRIAYWAESLLHAGLVGCFVYYNKLDQINLLRNYLPAALFLLSFLFIFLLRLGHHSNKFKSPLIMAAAGLLGWGAAFFPFKLGFNVFFSILFIIYWISGTIYPLLELARQRRSQNGNFIRNSFLLTQDRPRWAAALAFLSVSYVLVCLLAHREINGTLSLFLLIISVPLSLEVFCFLFPEKTDIRTRWKYGILAEGGVLLLTASQYVHNRFWYYFALAILALACFLFIRKLKDLTTASKITSGLAVWAVLALLLPSFTLGYNPGKLASMARVPHGAIALKSYPNLMMVKDKNGMKGAMIRNEVVLPPQFEDIRTYARMDVEDYYAYNHEMTVRGDLRDVIFFVKEKGSYSYEKVPLSLFPAPFNRISQDIAQDYQSFIQNADSLFKSTVKAVPSGYGDYFNQGWEQLLRYYDPDIPLSHAWFYKDQPELCWDYARKYIIYTGAYALSSHFLDERNWYDEKPNVLRATMFARFFAQTQILPEGFVEGYRSDMMEGTEYRKQLDMLLTSPADSAIQMILDTPDLRKQVYSMIFSRYSQDQNKFTLLSLRIPQINEFVFRLMELEQKNPVVAAFYSLFLGDFDKAEQFSRLAFEESDSATKKSHSASNLIPALFHKGELQECRDLLDQYAFRRIEDDILLIDGLYRNLDLFQRYGVLTQDEQKEYRNLLKNYSDDVFRGKRLYYFGNDDKFAFYFDNVEYSESFRQFEQIDLFFDGEPLGAMDAFLVSDWWDSPGIMLLQDGKKGFINRETGRIIYPASADHAWFFSEGRAFIEEGGVLRVINTEGQPALQKTFEDPRDYDSSDFVAIDFVYHDGVAPMIDGNGHMGLIDTLGNWVIKPEYDYITQPEYDGFRHLMKDGKLFLMEGVSEKTIRPAHPLVFDFFGILTFWDPSASRRMRYQPLEYTLGSLSGKSYSRLLLSYNNTSIINLLHDGSMTAFEGADWDMKVVLSPDASSFVSYETDSHVAYMTDIATKQKEIHFTDEGQSDFRAFVFSKDGKKAASAHENGMLRIWDVETGQCTASYPSECDIVALDFSPDGSTLVAADASNGIVLYWPLEKTPVRLDAHSDSVRDVKFSHGGDWFASCSDDTRIIIWDKSGKQIRTIVEKYYSNPKSTLAISPDDRQVATYDKANAITVFNVQTGMIDAEFAMQCGGPPYMIWSEE